MILGFGDEPARSRPCDTNQRMALIHHLQELLSRFDNRSRLRSNPGHDSGNRRGDRTGIGDLNEVASRLDVIAETGPAYPGSGETACNRRAQCRDTFWLAHDLAGQPFFGRLRYRRERCGLQADAGSIGGVDRDFHDAVALFDATRRHDGLVPRILLRRLMPMSQVQHHEPDRSNGDAARATPIDRTPRVISAPPLPTFSRGSGHPVPSSPPQSPTAASSASPASVLRRSAARFAFSALTTASSASAASSFPVSPRS